MDHQHHHQHNNNNGSSNASGNSQQPFAYNPAATTNSNYNTIDSGMISSASISSTLRGPRTMLAVQQQPPPMSSSDYYPSNNDNDNGMPSASSSHAVMIGGTNVPQQNQFPPGIQLRPKQSFDISAAANYTGENPPPTYRFNSDNNVSSSSLPSNNPYLTGAMITGYSHAHIPPPPPPPLLSSSASTGNTNNQLEPGNSWSTPLPSPGIPIQQQYHYSPQLNSTTMTSSDGYQAVPIESAYSQNGSNSRVNSATQQQQQQQQQQTFPVSLPGLPPIGPASAGLAAYAADSRSPRIVRDRSRRRLHQTYDHSGGSSPNITISATANRGSSYSSSESSPAPISALPPLIRQTISNNSSLNCSPNGMPDTGGILRREPSAMSTSIQSIRGSDGSERGSVSHGYSPLTGGRGSAAIVNSIPSGQGTPMMQDTRDLSPYAPANMDTDGSSSQRHHRAHASASVEGQFREYANSVASMTHHMGWNNQSIIAASTGDAAVVAATTASPLRAEIQCSRDNMISTAPVSRNIPSMVDSLVASSTGPPRLPSTDDNNSNPTPMSSSYSQEQQATLQNYGTLPRVSGQRSLGGANQSARNSSATPNILNDYYAVKSPVDPTYSGNNLGGGAASGGAAAASLLPMVEVGQSSSNLMSSTNMDQINAQSQQYLQKRRRRLTQTMHNRQRSGSAAAEVANRLSATRLNTIPLSSPVTNTHVNSAVNVDSSERMQSQPIQYNDRHTEYQPIQQQQQQQQPPPPTLQNMYAANDPMMYSTVGTNQMLLAQAQAQAQAEYMQGLQQEQMRVALEQQQLKLKLAQEQELIRFRRFRPILNMTVDIVETYRKCHPEFYYESARRPRRVLTHPSDGVKNDGFDNENSDYILYVNDIIGEKDGHQYLILEMLGSGTFGQVVKCQNIRTGELVAVKVIKNKTAYYNQSMTEVQMLDVLNNQYDTDNQHHILRLREWFVFRHHLIFVNELLSINLYDLLKQNQYQGLSTNLVRILVQQLLDAMVVLKNARIIHADLKPENILLESMEKPVVKIIDFGSACFEWHTVFTYIQSRFYRSPEVILGLPYSSRIDMWSLGCIVAELYLGLPLFPGTSEYNQLFRIVDLLGVPPASMLERAGRTDEFFNYLGPGIWELKPMDQYARERNVEVQQSKRYFTATTLEELVTTYPVRRRMSGLEEQREYQTRIALIDFLRGLLQLDPGKRWSPVQASMHPFITGESFVGPFIPSNVPENGHGGSSRGSNNNNYQHPRHQPPPSSGYYNQQQQQQQQQHHLPQGNGGSGGYIGQQQQAVDADSQGSMLYGQGLPLYNNNDAMTSNVQANGLTAAASTNHNSNIPGAFPMLANSSGGSNIADPNQQSSYYSLSNGAARRESNGRTRATTIGYMTASGIASEISMQSSGENAVPTLTTTIVNNQIGSFLGDDPSASHLSDFLTTTTNSSDSRGGGSGRITHDSYSHGGNSEYSGDSGSYGWAATTYSDKLKITGSYGTRTGSLYAYITSGPQNQQRQFLVNERQQQRLAHQRMLYQSEFGSSNEEDGSVSANGLLTSENLDHEGGSNYSTQPLLPNINKSLTASDNASTSQQLQQQQGEDSALFEEGDDFSDFEDISPSNIEKASVYYHGQRQTSGGSSRVLLNKPGIPIHPHLASNPSFAPFSVTTLAGARLVSNFSPLTVSTTSKSVASCSGVDGGGSNVGHDENDSQNVYPFSINSGDCLEQSNNEPLGNDETGSGSRCGSDNSDFSVSSSISRPLTQAPGGKSDDSLSMYSATSDYSYNEDGDTASGSSWSQSYSGDSDDLDLYETPLSLSRARTRSGGSKDYHQQQRYQPPTLPPIHLQLSRSLDKALSMHLDREKHQNHPLPAVTSSSIYQAPRYAAYSQEILVRRQSSKDVLALDARDRDSWVVADEIDGSVEAISQADHSEYNRNSDSDDEDDNVTEDGIDEAPSVYEDHAGQNLNGTTLLFADLDLDRSSRPISTYTDSVNSDPGHIDNDVNGHDSGVSSDREEGDGDYDADANNNGTPSQDTVVFTGKLHPHKGIGSYMCGPSSPISPLMARGVNSSNGVRSVSLSAALQSHPQRVSKRGIQTRRSSDRSSLKDSMRMIEALRRMGKWTDTPSNVNINQIAATSDDEKESSSSSYKMLVLDPIIVSMSPRLLPQAGGHH